VAKRTKTKPTVPTPPIEKGFGDTLNLPKNAQVTNHARLQEEIHQSELLSTFSPSFYSMEGRFAASPSHPVWQPTPPPVTILPPITPFLGNVDLINYHDREGLEDVSIAANVPSSWRDSISGQSSVRSQYILSTEDSMWRSTN
jgi:hypothetical protein